MTDVINAAANGEGQVLAGYHEIPMLSVNKAEELLERMKNSNLISFAALGKPGERICEVPFNPEKVGLVTLSGLNPVAAAAEAGIQVSNRPMCGMIGLNFGPPLFFWGCCFFFSSTSSSYTSAPPWTGSG